MTVTVGVLNLILGAVYTQYGTMTIIDMKRSWRSLGFSHFGAAWIAIVGGARAVPGRPRRLEPRAGRATATGARKVRCQPLS
jgi:hypothetical protein